VFVFSLFLFSAKGMNATKYTLGLRQDKMSKLIETCVVCIEFLHTVHKR